MAFSLSSNRMSRGVCFHTEGKSLLGFRLSLRIWDKSSHFHLMCCCRPACPWGLILPEIRQDGLRWQPPRPTWGSDRASTRLHCSCSFQEPRIQQKDWSFSFRIRISGFRKTNCQLLSHSVLAKMCLTVRNCELIMKVPTIEISAKSRTVCLHYSL